MGTLENTVFTILDPTGRRKLIRGHRGPRHLFDDGAEMAATMREIAARYPKAKAPAAPQALGLPQLADLRLALNVAACDRRPLVVISARDKARRTALVKRVTALAWSTAFAGKLEYVVVSRPAELKTVDATGREGLLVVQPGTYGLDGTVLSSAPTSADAAALAAALRAGLAAHRDLGTSNIRRHIESGRRAGVHWKTAIPVTDPGIPGGRRR